MPLARWAKLTMLVQSAVSLSLGALVIARAVNILPGPLTSPGILPVRVPMAIPVTNRYHDFVTRR